MTGSIPYAKATMTDKTEVEALAEPDYWSRPLVERLRERAALARIEGTGTAVGDAVHFEEAAAEITDLRDKLASAIKERDSICEKAVEKTFALDAAEARAAEAEAESDRLRLALEPFAREADNAGGLVLGPDTDDWTLNHHKLTLGDIRRARSTKEQP